MRWRWLWAVPLVVPLAAAGGLGLMLLPLDDPQPLPPRLIAVDSPEGRALLAEADAVADLATS